MSRKTGPGPWGWLMYVCASFVATVLVQHKQTPFEFQVLAIVVSGIFAAIARAITRRRNRHIQAERDEIAGAIYSTAIEGRVPPRFFLYLRPFATTASLSQRIPNPSSQNPYQWVGPPDLEQRLANVLSSHAPLIGLGFPGNALGSGHAEADDAEWKLGIDALLKHCERVFLVPGSSEGTMWEIGAICALPEVLERTVFIMPASTDDFPVREHWEATVVGLQRFGMKLPAYVRGGLLFSLNAEGDVDCQVPLGNMIRESAFTATVERFLTLKRVSVRPGPSEPSASADPAGAPTAAVACDGSGQPHEHEVEDVATAAGAAIPTPSFFQRNQAKIAFVAAAVAVSTLAFGVWWGFSTRVDRARQDVYSYVPERQRGAMAVLADNVDQDEAFTSIVQWFLSRPDRELAPPVVAELSRAFARRKPALDLWPGFVTAVTALQIRGQYAEARQWIEDYDNAPAVTDALLSHLETLNESDYKSRPGARGNLSRELAARPRDAATVDMALQHWLRTRSFPMLSYLQMFEPSLVKSRVTAAMGTPAAGEDEWRLMACQVERCTGADVPRIIRSARADANGRESGGARSENTEEDKFKLFADGPERAWQRVSAIGSQLQAHRRALVSIGSPAVGGILSLFYDSSTAMWSFAALTLIDIDRDALLRQLQADMTRDAQSAAKAILALQALPVGDTQADRVLVGALSSRSPRVSSFALDAARLRLKGQVLVDGVLAYVSRRDDLSEEEVDSYKDTLKSAGPDAAAYVANAMNRLLDRAGDPQELPWIQKALVIDVLRDVGTMKELPVLGRLRKDRGGYVWVRSQVDPATLTIKEVEEEVSFADASDAAADAIRQRH